MQLKLSTRSWSFTVLLLSIYFLSFAFWRTLEGNTVRLSALVIFSVLAFALREVTVKGYFHNRLEAMIHGAAIVDLFLEGMLSANGVHSPFGLCLGAFGVVFVAYRLYLQHLDSTRLIPVPLTSVHPGASDSR